MLKNNKGFTIVELLIVIAIIGVLAAIVLSSVSGARTLSGDASAQSNLTTIQTQAHLYNTTNATYGTSSTCTTASTMWTDPTIAAAVSQATTNSAAISCSSSATAYAVVVRLKGNNNTYDLCVDPNGTRKKSIHSSWSSCLAGPGAKYALNTSTSLCN